MLSAPVWPSTSIQYLQRRRTQQADCLLEEVLILFVQVYGLLLQLAALPVQFGLGCPELLRNPLQLLHPGLVPLMLAPLLVQLALNVLQGIWASHKASPSIVSPH